MVLGFQRCNLALLNADGESFSLRTLLETRRDKEGIDLSRVALGVGFCGLAMESQQVRLIKDSDRDGREIADPAMEDGGLASLLALPLRSSSGVLGCLVFGTTQADGFSPDDVQIAKVFATHIALAIERQDRVEELRQAKELADRANQAKSDFLSSMSHELRTPLNAILGFAQMLDFNAKEPLTETQKSSVEHIMTGGHHLLELINEVLDLVRIEADRMELEMADISPEDLIEQCVDLVRNQAGDRAITLTVHGLQGER